ncbi:hypothetical protein JCM8202v2_002261 [Rhodotorula sphaerocarpa]
MPFRDAYDQLSEDEKRHPVMCCLQDPERSQLRDLLLELLANPCRLDELQGRVLAKVERVRILYDTYQDTPPLFHVQETLGALAEAEQEGRDALFLWKQLMCAKLSNPAMPLNPNAESGPTVDACREQAQHLKQFGIDLHIRDTAPVCLVPALEAGSERLNLAATRAPTVAMLDVTGLLTQMEFVALTRKHGAKVLLFEACGRWAMRVAKINPNMTQIDLARDDPQSGLFSNSPFRVSYHPRVQRASPYIDLRSYLLLREVLSDRLELGIGQSIDETYSRRAGVADTQCWSFDRICAELGVDLGDVNEQALHAAWRATSEKAMAIVAERGTGLNGAAAFEGDTVHGGARSGGSGGCASARSRRAIAKVSLETLHSIECHGARESDRELAERYRSGDVLAMAGTLEAAGFFVSEAGGDDDGAAIAETYLRALPLLRLRARLLATEDPNALDFANERLPEIPLDAVTALLASSHKSARWEKSQLAAFLASAEACADSTRASSAPDEPSRDGSSETALPQGPASVSSARLSSSSDVAETDAEQAKDLIGRVLIGDGVSGQRDGPDRPESYTAGLPSAQEAHVEVRVPSPEHGISALAPSMTDDLGGEEPSFDLAATPRSSRVDAIRDKATLPAAFVSCPLELGHGNEVSSGGVEALSKTTTDERASETDEVQTDEQTAGEKTVSLAPGRRSPSSSAAVTSDTASETRAPLPEAAVTLKGLHFRKVKPTADDKPLTQPLAWTATSFEQSFRSGPASCMSLSPAGGRSAIPRANPPSVSSRSTPGTLTSDPSMVPGGLPNTPSSLMSARIYGGAPASAAPRSEVEIAHEPLGPGQATNIEGGGGYKNCSVLRVVQPASDDPRALRLPTLAALLREAAGDHYDDIKIIFIAPLPADPRWIVCKLVFKSEESWLDYHRSRRTVAVEIVKEHNDRSIKRPLGGSERTAAGRDGGRGANLT